MRIDKLLWFLRFTRTRGLAQEIVAAGHIRLNGRRIEKASQPVDRGDVLVLPLRHGVQIIEIEVVPSRRGPSAEARNCYRVLDETRAFPIAAVSTELSNQGERSP